MPIGFTAFFGAPNVCKNVRHFRIRRCIPASTQRRYEPHPSRFPIAGVGLERFPQFEIQVCDRRHEFEQVPGGQVYEDRIFGIDRREIAVQAG